MMLTAFFRRRRIRWFAHALKRERLTEQQLIAAMTSMGATE